MPPLLCFTNCQTCVSGELIPQDLYFSPDQGMIVPNYYYRTEGVERIDLGGAIVAPGFLELQTNGLQGVHFTQLGQKDDDEKMLQVARSLLVYDPDGGGGQLEEGETCFPHMLSLLFSASSVNLGLERWRKRRSHGSIYWTECAPYKVLTPGVLEVLRDPCM
jgi:hypothetical protein